MKDVEKEWQKETGNEREGRMLFKAREAKLVGRGNFFR